MIFLSGNLKKLIQSLELNSTKLWILLPYGRQPQWKTLGNLYLQNLRDFIAHLGGVGNTKNLDHTFTCGSIKINCTKCRYILPHSALWEKPVG